MDSMAQILVTVTLVACEHDNRLIYDLDDIYNTCDRFYSAIEV